LKAAGTDDPVLAPSKGRLLELSPPAASNLAKNADGSGVVPAKLAVDSGGAAPQVLGNASGGAAPHVLGCMVGVPPALLIAERRAYREHL
jgi:hypothetical protein